MGDGISIQWYGGGKGIAGRRSDPLESLARLNFQVRE